MYTTTGFPLAYRTVTLSLLEAFYRDASLYREIVEVTHSLLIVLEKYVKAPLILP